MNEHFDVIEDGQMLIDDENIIEIGKTCVQKYDQCIDGHHGILLPGMINIHTHLGMIPFRGLGDDCPDRLRRFLFPLESKYMTADLVYHSSKYAMAEMLLSGITTFMDMYYFEDEVAKAADEMKMRGFVGETIVDFHNMEFRMKQLREAVAANASGRLSEVQDIVDAIEKDADEMCCAERLYREGKLPKRICHCDTKVSNMLFDENGEVLCVIDLDTTMPSFVFSDFGDFLRSAANTGKEDEQDLNNVRFNMEIFKPFAKGYIQSARTFLTPIEIEHLPYAATLFPYMQAVRFLADYINGDTYYRTTYDGQNLVRTKAQYKLYQEAKAAIPEMKAYINSLL